MSRKQAATTTSKRGQSTPARSRKQPTQAKSSWRYHHVVSFLLLVAMGVAVILPEWWVWRNEKKANLWDGSNARINQPVLANQLHDFRGRPLQNASSIRYTSNNELQSQEFLPYCEEDPGRGDAEGGVHGVPFLMRVRDLGAEIRQQPPTVTLVCVLPFLSPSVQSSIVRTDGQDCDALVILTHPGMATTTASLNTIPVTVLTVDDSSSAASSFWNKLVPVLMPYQWIYWASPDRYLYGPFAKYFLELATSNNAESPQWLAGWTMLKAGNFKGYHDLELDKRRLQCSMDDKSAVPRFWNRAVVKLLSGSVPTAGKMSCIKNETTISCLANAAMQSSMQSKAPIACLTWGLPVEKRLDLHWYKTLRYVEIHVPNVFSRMRLYAILTDQCNDHWNRFRGALDADGQPGYVPDPYRIRQNPLEFQVDGICDDPLGYGDEGEGEAASQAILKIRADLQEPKLPVSQQKKVLCMVYTHSGRHESHLRAIVETWAPRCDGFWAASNLTDPTLNAINLLHEGPESYENMWLKVVAMWKYAYQHFLNDFDFFHIGGDDHYVLGENLRYLISTGGPQGPWDYSAPLYLGGSIAIAKKLRFCGGGSGYTLNNVLLKILVEDLLPNDVRCRPHYYDSKEDMIIAACMRSLHPKFFRCMDTNDEKGEMRYHPASLHFHANWQTYQSAFNWKLLVDYHGISYKPGLGQISSRSVSFHVKESKGWKPSTEGGALRRYHALLYRHCSI